MLANVQQTTIKSIIEATVALVHTDEYGVYARLSAPVSLGLSAQDSR
ncbi:hypothetical protein [Microvirga tunisiensis]|nr:hypothetical protein [Microvirga tunisiensis]